MEIEPWESKQMNSVRSCLLALFFGAVQHLLSISVTEIMS